MTYPLKAPHDKVTTAYGKRGAYWSCNEDASGHGVHTGVDLAAPSGTPIYAPCDGQIRHRSYGSAFGSHQFAISPDAGQAFADGEVFFAHTRTRLADGVHVTMGQKIAEVGAEGNVSGPHLHMEYHADTKDTWNCSVHDNPQPVLDHGGGGSSDDGPHVTEHVYRSKCGYGEPSNGDEDSDTVKELQERLNRISLHGGQELPITGKYATQTDEEVRLWQDQICGDTPDPAKKSYLGPAQFAAMFPDSIYTRHDDGDPAIATDGGGGSGGEGQSGTTLGRHLAALGYTVHDDDVPAGREATWRAVEFLMVHHTGPHGTAEDMAEYLRRSTDPDTYPPLAQLLVDQAGEVWICSHELAGQEEPGRASHAGLGTGYGIPDDTMNERALGIECLADGTKPLAAYPELYDTLIDLLADLADYYTVPVDHIIGHKEWSSTGKVDPLDDMTTLRADVADALDTDPPDPPDPPDTITLPVELTLAGTVTITLP